MAEHERPARTVIIQYNCDHCDAGVMEPHGNTAWFSEPPQYQHRCSNCGASATFDKRYPYVTHQTLDS
jgi:hypothetical protein